jgi:hypothetical protein
MARIQFDYRGQNFKVNVSDSFLKRDPKEQRKLLEAKLIEKDRKTKLAPKDDKGFLDYLSLLGRPRAAAVVGAKESKLGSDIYKAFGGVDLTPGEGFIEGARKGWMGEEDVRTQDFLPENMPGFLRGVVGFAGDVLTDPLTYAGGWAGRSIYNVGKGIGIQAKAHTPRKVASFLQKIKDSDKAHDLARTFNVPYGKSRLVKGVAQESEDLLHPFRKKLATDEKELNEWMANIAATTGKTPEVIHSAVRNFIERPGMVDPTPELIKGTDDVLGAGASKKIEGFEDTLQDYMEQEAAQGMMVKRVHEDIGYFPDRMTPAGRESVKRGTTDDFFPRGAPGAVEPSQFITREAFMRGRKLEGTVDQKNAELMGRLEGLGGGPEPKFFHTDPGIAIPLRGLESAVAQQRHNFINRVTDFGDNIGMGKGGNIKPMVNVGNWVRRNSDDPDNVFFEYRTIDDAGNPVWKEVTEEMRGWVTPRGIKDRHINEAAVLAKGTAAYDDAIASGLKPREAARLREEAWKELGGDEMSFKAPRSVAKQISDQLELISGQNIDSEALRKFLSFYDGIQEPWKSWTLAIRPGFHSRNALGNILNAYTVTGLGANIPRAIETFKNSAKLQYYSRFNGSDMMRQRNVDRLLAQNKNLRAGVEGMPKINDADWLAANFADTGFSMEKIADEALNRGINAGHYRADVLANQEKVAEVAKGARGKWQSLQKALGTENPLIKGGFFVGGTIEGNARMAVFLDTLRKMKMGDDLEWIAPDGRKVKLSEFGEGDNVFWTSDIKPTAGGRFEQVRRLMTKEDAKFDIASNKVKEALFDYKDLSRNERFWFKRLVPFYTWTRKNTPLQLKHLVLNPQRAQKLNLAREQFEYETGDLDQSDYGAFWGDRVPVFLGKENQGVVRAFTLLNNVPMAELVRYMKPQHLITEMVSPIPKELFEQIFNYDSFRRKPIKEFKGESKDMLGVALPPRLWKLAQVLVPLTEVNRLNPGGVFGEQIIDPVTGQQRVTPAWGGWGASRESNPEDIEESARWLRFASGQRVYDINLNKQRYFLNKNMENDLKSLQSKLKRALQNQENRRARQLMRLIEEVQRQEVTDPFMIRR